MHYRNSAGLAPMLTERLKARTWFESAEVDIENPEQLWLEFKEMPPFFVTNHIPDEAEPQHMKDYLRRTGRKKGDGKTLFGALSVKKLLLYAPMLRWYVEHGVVIKTVDRTIDYQVTKIFTWFVEQVTEAQRTRDVDRSKAALAEVFKQLGNSDYGKLVEALERQTGVIYTLDELSFTTPTCSTCQPCWEKCLALRKGSCTIEILQALRLCLPNAWKLEQEMWTGAKPRLLRCSNSWETVITGNSLRRWSGRQEWSTRWMRRWTDRCEARTSVNWKSSGKQISWKARSHILPPVGRSR